MFPKLELLTEVLSSLFAARGQQFDVVGRKPNPYSSTFPSEIVTCKSPDGKVTRLLCKYSGGASHESHGHRGDVAYEALVYRHILQATDAAVPEFFGSYQDPENDDTWLVLEYVDNSVTLNKKPQSVIDAARWIGRFHARGERMRHLLSVPLLNSFDRDYYIGWAERTILLGGPLHDEFPWLTDFCERFGELSTALLTPAPTLIHGEYYPQNILVGNDTLYPIDWESAAQAVGEIDLASLTEGWDSDIVEHCKREYVRSRWPHGAPDHFEDALSAAKAYWSLRWLGEHAYWNRRKPAISRCRELRRITRQWGVC